MRWRIANSFRPLSACFLQAHGEVTSAEQIRSRPSPLQTESQLSHRPFLAKTITPSKQARSWQRILLPDAQPTKPATFPLNLPIRIQYP